MFCYWSHSSGLLSTKVSSRMQSSGNSGVKSLIAPKIQSLHAGKLCLPYHQTHDPRLIPKTNLTLFKKCCTNFRHQSEILLWNPLVFGVCCTQLLPQPHLLPNENTNTRLFKGHSLFASSLLLRQMFQGTTEDKHVHTGGKRRCPGV